MKSIGVFAVVLSCLAMGWGRVMMLRKEIQTLNALSKGIWAIRSELSCRLCPMDELLSLAAGQTEMEAAGFFRTCAEELNRLNENSFSEIWADACRRCLTTLSAESRGQLAALGASLGRYEIGDQLAACDRFLRSTEEKEKYLRQKFPEQSRLILAVSAAAGVFLCLLIL